MEPSLRAARADWRARAGADDGGFSLIEVVVAMSLLLIVVLAFGAAMTGSFFATNTARARQVAVTLADTALDQARGLQPADLLLGRTQTNVNTQWGAAPASVDLSETTAERW